MNQQTRREFMQKAAVGSASLSFLSSSLYAAPSEEKLNTAHIGVGGMGSADLGSISSHKSVNVVALCDIDSRKLAAASKKHPNAKTFADFRDMFKEMADQFDAVVVSTPDHTHAPAAMTALNHNKHVYCQKPLTHEVYEARRLREVAEAKGLVTQMGIQASAGIAYRAATRMIQDGVIGKVSEVHAWSHKNWGYDGGPFTGEHKIPDHVDWNLWLGTAANRPFEPKYHHPGNWRKLVDFGTGTLGDMGVHIFDTPYRALALTVPTWAKTTCRTPTGVGHPEKNIVKYEFPGTQFTTKTLRWTWYDGSYAPKTGIKIPHAENLVLPNQGALFKGEKGICLLPHVANPQFYLEGKFSEIKQPELKPRNHYHQWVDACLGKTKTSSPFSYGGPLTESLLLGVVANRFPETKLEWDAANLKVTNVSEANDLISRTYRDGFAIKDLEGLPG
jgi:predicted dehydrogenase